MTVSLAMFFIWRQSYSVHKHYCFWSCINALKQIGQTANLVNNERKQSGSQSHSNSGDRQIPRETKSFMNCHDSVFGQTCRGPTSRNGICCLDHAVNQTSCVLLYRSRFNRWWCKSCQRRCDMRRFWPVKWRLESSLIAGTLQNSSVQWTHITETVAMILLQKPTSPQCSSNIWWWSWNVESRWRSGGKF